MSLIMSKEEREAFLADLHVAVFSVAEGNNGTLTAPIWYWYDEGGEPWILTGENSRKGKLLMEAKRFCLCVQTETPPYKYVSVEGPVSAIEQPDLEKHARPLSRRYLGDEMGDAYIEQDPELKGQILVRMKPERWLTTDYAKMGSLG